MQQTWDTLDHLAAEGVEYVGDWCMDDQPVWLKTRQGRILAVPYPQELNDSAAIIGRRVSAAEFSDMVIDQFHEMVEQSREQPLVMGIALHSMIAGQPFRLRQLRRAFAHLARHRLSHRKKIKRGCCTVMWKSKWEHKSAPENTMEAAVVTGVSRIIRLVLPNA